MQEILKYTLHVPFIFSSANEVDICEIFPSTRPELSFKFEKGKEEEGYEFGTNILNVDGFSSAEEAKAYYTQIQFILTCVALRNNFGACFPKDVYITPTIEYDLSTMKVNSLFSEDDESGLYTQFQRGRAVIYPQSCKIKKWCSWEANACTPTPPNKMRQEIEEITINYDSNKIKNEKLKLAIDLYLTSYFIQSSYSLHSPSTIISEPGAAIRHLFIQLITVVETLLERQEVTLSEGHSIKETRKSIKGYLQNYLHKDEHKFLDGKIRDLLSKSITWSLKEFVCREVELIKKSGINFEIPGGIEEMQNVIGEAYSIRSALVHEGDFVSSRNNKVVKKVKEMSLMDKEKYMKRLIEKANKFLIEFVPRILERRLKNNENS